MATIACIKLRPMALLGLLLIFLVGIEASGHGPMYPAACPPALAFSDTASETAKQKCYAPKVLQCSGSGSTAAYASSSSASSSTASPSTAAPSSSSSAATDSSSSSGSSPSPASDSSSASTAAASSASSAVAASSTAATTALGQNEPCKCDLIMYLLQFKMTLTIVEQATFEQYLMVDLRVIVIDVTLTDAQKIVKCGRKMRNFCGSYPSIGNKMRVVQISDFGYAHDFAFAAAVAYEDDDSDSVDALVDNTGSTNFSLAIISGTSLDQCGVGSASNWGQFVKEHKQVHKRSIAALDKDRKRAHSHDSLKYIYFKNYPTQETCVRSIKLKAGDYDATVGDFIDFCDHHDKETQIISSLMTDDLTTGVSPFISSIDSGVQAANASGQYNSIDVQDAQTFVSNCKSQFATQTDGNSRLQLTLSLFAGKSQKCRELLKVIQISGATVSCLVADVVSIGNMCANGFACQNITLGGPGESMQETPLVDSYNVSSLVVSSQVWLDSLVFGSGYYYSYKSYHNSIVNCCYLSQYGSNVTARIECAKAKISTYSGNNVTIQANYWKTKMPTVIKQKVVSGVISADYGTLGCFCGCTSC